MTSRIKLSLLLVALFAALTGSCGVPVDSGSGTNYDTARRNMVRWHNDVRVSQGMPELFVDPRLTQIAVEQAQWIAQRRELTHIDRFGGDVRDRADAAGYIWEVIGENLGVGDSGAAVFDAWLSSSSHRSNIFDARYLDIGVGRVVTGSFGQDEWWVVVYGVR